MCVYDRRTSNCRKFLENEANKINVSYKYYIFKYTLLCLCVKAGPRILGHCTKCFYVPYTNFQIKYNPLQFTSDESVPHNFYKVYKDFYKIFIII